MVSYIIQTFYGSFKMTYEDIIIICKKFDIKNYTINSDMSVTVFENVDLKRNFSEKSKILPLRFKKVAGFFDCGFMNLTSLKGCPEHVDGNFYCNDNSLLSLKFAPCYVGESFFCHLNRLTDLEYSPRYVGGGFYCYGNKLTKLKGCPESINGKFNCDWNNLNDLNFGPKHISGCFSFNMNAIFKRQSINRIDVGGKINATGIMWSF